MSIGKKTNNGAIVRGPHGTTQRGYTPTPPFGIDDSTALNPVWHVGHTPDTSVPSPAVDHSCGCDTSSSPSDCCSGGDGGSCGCD